MNRKLILFIATLTAAQFVAATAHLAFSNVSEGDVAPNRVLPSLHGEAAPMLADDQLNVLIFLKPVQQHSLDLVAELADLEAEFAGKPVHWAAIVPDRFETSLSRAAFPDSALQMPILLDPEDAMYSEYGVVLHPSIAIADEDHVMLKYLHFHKVNFKNIIRAYLQYHLGEIDADTLQAELNPPAAVLGGDRAKAARSLKLAQMLFKTGKVEAALEHALTSVETDSTFVDALLLVAEIHLAGGDAAAASSFFERALTLDPQNERALQNARIDNE